MDLDARLVGIEADGVNLGTLGLALIRKDVLERVFPRALEFGQRDLLAARLERVQRGGGAKDGCRDVFRDLFDRGVIRDLEHEGTVRRVEKRLDRECGLHADTQ